MSERARIRRPETGRDRRGGREPDDYVERSERYEETRDAIPSVSNRSASRYEGQSTPRYTPLEPLEHRSRRGSESTSGRAEHSRERGGQSSSQPIAIVNDSARRHRSERHEQARGERAYLVDEQQESRSYSRSIQRPSSYGAARAGETLSPKPWSEQSLDSVVVSGMGTLKLDDVVGSPGQYTVSPSPLAPAPWGPSPSQVNIQGPNYEATTQQSPFSSLATPVLSGLSQPTLDKGKGIETAAPVPQTSRVIRGTAGERETLDRSYKVRSHDYKTFFRPGRVFSTLWTDAFAEPTNQNESENNQFMSAVSYVRYHERVHSKIRRFVVVRLRDRFCTCLPVTTYDGRGYTKRGINLGDHGLIYSNERGLYTVPGITKSPLKVRLSNGAERLVNPSYINYGRVYTVETNVKVKDVGELDTNSRALLTRYFNDANILPENENAGPGPALTPQARAVQFVGMGGGVFGPSQPSGFGPPSQTTTLNFPQSNYPLQGGYNQAAISNSQPTPAWSNTSTFGSPVPSSYSGTTAGGYTLQPNPTQYTTSGNFTYSAKPVFGTIPTSPSAQFPAASYASSANPLYAPISENYQTSPSGAPQYYYGNQAPASAPQYQDRQQEEDLRLPTVDQAREMRPARRESVSRPQVSRRDRDERRDRDDRRDRDERDQRSDGHRRRH